MTYSKVTLRPTQFAEVFVQPANDDFVNFDVGTVAELDGQVGICAFVKPLAGIHGEC